MEAFTTSKKNSGTSSKNIQENKNNKSNTNTKANQPIIYGSDITKRPEGVTCMRFKNIHGFPEEEVPPKYDMLQSESAEYGHGYNIQLFLEPNQRWNVMQLDTFLR